jgi:PAS domain S-box-containing protein
VLKGQLEKFTLEYPCHSSSERRWFIGRVTPFLTIGSPQVVVAHEDITERKEAEQRLNAQYAVTRILEESATLDEVFPKILETISESLGWQISKVWHLDRPADVLRCGQTWYAPSVDVAESGEITQQSTLPRGVGLPGRVWASGKPVWISDAVRDPKSIPFNEGLHGAVAFPILLRGEVLGVMGFFSREIRPPDAAVLEMLRTFGTQIGQYVERKQAEKTLRESEAQLNAILDNLTEGVLMADLQGHVIFANPAARTMLGVSPEEPLEELPDPWEDFHLPEAVAHCAQNREGIEARVRYKETFLRIRLECLAEHENDQGDVLVVVQDLSEGRRLEASQQRFLANAAHQLSTPTMAILGAAELLATGDDADPTIRRRLLNHIFSEGRRMQQLSETLLRLSRVGWDQREPSSEILDLSRAGQQAIERMAPLIENMGLRALVEGESTTTTCVRGDPQWLQEVLLTLLSNAIKHSSRGADIRLRVSAGTITVEDEGAGISPDDLPHIFERFYRGKGSSEGFGLGLPICRELIERMGGSISISSREGVGTAVEIQLPER